MTQLLLFSETSAAERALAKIPAGYAKPHTDDPLVVCLGMGVDSIAMLIGLQHAGLRPDAILFADTRSEKPETYLALPVVQAWLDRVGFPQVTVVLKTPPIAPYKSLAGYCFAMDTLPSLAFTGGPMGHGQCSTAWKIEPQVAWLKTWPVAQAAWATGALVTTAVGYDAGDADGVRCAKAMSKTYPEGTRKWFPLRDWGWRRAECQDVIRAELGAQLTDAIGQDVPVKSACYMCPATTREEVIDLADQHWDLALAGVAMEYRALNGRIKFGRAGLGINWSWREVLEEAGRLPADWRAQAMERGLIPSNWDAYVAEIDATLPVDERELAKAKEKRHRLGRREQGPRYQFPADEKKRLREARRAWLAEVKPPDHGNVPEPEHNTEDTLGLVFERVEVGRSKSHAQARGRALPVVAAA